MNAIQNTQTDLAPIELVIVGCGFAAQQIHIPRLIQMPGSFNIRAVADCLPQAARQAAALAGHCPVFYSLEQMLEQIQPEAVAVLTTLHAEPVETALTRGLDVFVEKPLCETPSDARRLEKLAKEKERVLMVGAMRAFDPAIGRILEIIAEISPLRWVEVRDYCGNSATTAGGDLIASGLQSGLPVNAGFQKNLLQTLLLEFIHDHSILRAVFGPAIEVRSAHATADGWSATGEMILSGDLPCLFAFCEFGVTSAPVFDVSLRLFGEKGCAEIRFGDANERGGCRTLISRDYGEPEQIVTDPFKLEWQAFERAVRSRQATINVASDGVADVELAWKIYTQCIEVES